MTRRSSVGLVLLILLPLVGACRDGISPELRGASLRIYLGSTAFDEQTVAVDSIFQLSARVLDRSGTPLEGQTVEWSSDRPEVADVDAYGTVVAKEIGTAHIIATHRVGADTARINVAPGYSRNELPDCDAREGLQLAVGEVAVLSGAETLPICLPGGDLGAEYTMVALNAGSTASSSLRIQVNSLGVHDGGAATSVQSSWPTSVDRSAAAGDRFHSRLREDVSRRLEPQLRAGVAADAFNIPAAQLALDQPISFNVETTSSNGCENPDPRGARVRAVGQHAVAVADTMNPAGGYTDEDYRGFVEFFDTEVWPLVTETFGEPSDIDENGKVIILFTRAVNELAANLPSNPGSYVGGFFFNRDLFPTSSCAGSNRSEMFYMLVPNPDPAVGERTFSKSFVARSTQNVLVHEFQHLVNDSRRLHINQSPVWEETWLNEGLSHIAEELMFYRISGLEPRSNLGEEAFFSPNARVAFSVFQLDNLERLAAFLRTPEYASVMGPDILATRGATWSFLRYAADRHGGNEAELWQRVARDSRESGLANLREALGAEPLEWAHDWATALYLDDTGRNPAAEHRLRSWNFREVYPALTSQRTYPLQVSRLYNGVPSILPLQGGGVGYTRAVVPGGGTAAIRYLTGTNPLLPVPSRVRVAVIRVK